MTEFNKRVSSVDRKGIMEVGHELKIFDGLQCKSIVGRSSIISEIQGLFPWLSDPKEIYSDSDLVLGRKCTKLKGDKFPIDFAAIMSNDGYLIIKGKTIFGAVGEMEGHSLALRIIANIKRNYI